MAKVVLIKGENSHEAQPFDNIVDALRATGQLAHRAGFQFERHATYCNRNAA